MTQDVLSCQDAGPAALQTLLRRYGLTLALVPATETIPGSFWGDSEAGLIGLCVYARSDTPVHSVLHEACHCVCMDSKRRAALNTDAGGDNHEENAVCYLQILLADFLPGVDRARLCADMDTWGYSFRLGSALRWFKEDAEDARMWLQQQGLIDAHNMPTWRMSD